MKFKYYQHEDNKRMTYILGIPLFKRIRNVYAMGGVLSL